jgi:hypothetical protein
MTKTTGTDFALLDMSAAHEKGTRIQLHHPQTEKPLPSWITLRGDESPEVQQFLRGEINAQIRRNAKPDSAPQTIEDSIKAAVEKLTIATITWEGIEWGSEPMPCTPENCRKLYSQKWVREQLFKALEDEGNFPLG